MQIGLYKAKQCHAADIRHLKSACLGVVHLNISLRFPIAHYQCIIATLILEMAPVCLLIVNLCLTIVALFS